MNKTPMQIATTFSLEEAEEPFGYLAIKGTRWFKAQYDGGAVIREDDDGTYWFVLKQDQDNDDSPRIYLAGPYETLVGTSSEFSSDLIGEQGKLLKKKCHTAGWGNLTREGATILHAIVHRCINHANKRIREDAPEQEFPGVDQKASD